MGNIKFNYLYRDGGNYKNWADVTFFNPDNLSVHMLARSFRAAFDDNLFIAHQVRIPEVFSFPDGIVTSDDHCYHEFDNVEITEDIPNDLFVRSIGQFLAEVKAAAAIGWRAFYREPTRTA
jgi:hypothetical protein